MRTAGEEGFGDDDGGGAAVGGGAALEFGEGVVDGRGGGDFGEGVLVAELGVGVFGAMGVVDAGDFGEVGFCGSVSVVGIYSVDWLGEIVRISSGEKAKLTSPYILSPHSQTSALPLVPHSTLSSPSSFPQYAQLGRPCPPTCSSDSQGSFSQNPPPSHNPPLHD